jgi:hypothetical protein
MTVAVIAAGTSMKTTIGTIAMMIGVAEPKVET